MIRAVGVLPGACASCKLLMSLARPLVLGPDAAQVEMALGGLFPGTLTVVRSRSISFPCTFCMQSWSKTANFQKTIPYRGIQLQHQQRGRYARKITSRCIATLTNRHQISTAMLKTRRSTFSFIQSKLLVPSYKNEAFTSKKKKTKKGK